MKPCKWIFILFALISQYSFGQAPQTYTSADIFLGLKKLNVLGSVLYIAAHPDDENTRLLSYFSKHRLYKTGYLSVTRGDGGQNLIGDEQGVELGLIRTQELLAARRIDGAEQFFTRAYDFGYSKTPDETFSKWNKEKILSDVVWVIRNFQPDVIITRFPTTGEGGHGHHTASAILANEAFSAAADPNRFPEHLKYVKPWQAKRIVWNTFSFGNTNTTSAEQLRFDVGLYNSILGKSYGEIAAESRSQHKSQGFGVPRSRGEAFEYFRTTGGAAPSTDLFEDVNTGWTKIKGGEKISELVNNIITSYDFSAPQKSVPQLVQLYKSLTALPDDFWRNEKIKEVQNLIEAAGGLWMEAITTEQYAVQGDSLRINFSVNDRLGAGSKLTGLTLENFDTTFNASLLPNKNFNFTKIIFVSPQKPLTQPYWLKEKMQEGYFEVTDQKLIGQADVQPSYTAKFTVNIAGESFTFHRPVKFKYTDPVKGEIYQPLFVVPFATVVTTPDILLFDKNKKQSREIALQLNANRKISGKAEVHVKSLDYDIKKNDTALNLSKNSSKSYSFDLNNSKLQRQTDYLYASVHPMAAKDDEYAFLALRSINYDHIPSIRYFFGDGVKLINLDLKTRGKKIGYIAGAGDKVPDALEQMGYDVSLLTNKELAKNSLQQFDAIITGVRAYNTNEWLNSYYEKLMKYVENGGNLIVQYNTSSQIGPVRSKIGPYSFTISRNRITDENTPVTFLQPQHQVLNFPNKISENDFKGWVQERSIYHADKPDAKFEAILRMNDPGEQPDDGSLIIAKHGKGFFTYTGLVFFRQLPAGVPGAYRLLANLIALNQLKPM